VELGGDVIVPIIVVFGTALVIHVLVADTRCRGREKPRVDTAAQGASRREVKSAR